MLKCTSPLKWSVKNHESAKNMRYEIFEFYIYILYPLTHINIYFIPFSFLYFIFNFYHINKYNRILTKICLKKYVFLLTTLNDLDDNHL